MRKLMEDQRNWLDLATEYSKKIEKDEELKRAKKVFYSVNRKAMKEGMKIFHKEVFNFIVKMNMISFNYYLDIFHTTLKYSNNNLLNEFYAEIQRQQVKISDDDIYGIFNLYSLWNSYIGFVFEYRLLMSLQYAFKGVKEIVVVSNDWLDYNHKVDIQVINHNTKKILNIQVKSSTWLNALNYMAHTQMIERLRSYERILKESDESCEYETMSAFVFSHKENGEIAIYVNNNKSLISIDDVFYGKSNLYGDLDIPKTATFDMLLKEIKIAIGVITKEEIEEERRIQEEFERLKKEDNERKRQKIMEKIAS